MVMTLQLAAIVYASGFPIDTLMAEIAMRLRDEAVRLGGVVQRNEPDADEMLLEDLASGALFSITAQRGAASAGCRLDPAGLAAAGGAVAAALAGPVDLLIINKFGRQETLGQGLRAEIAAGLMSGVPLVIAVREDFLDAWSAFAGEDWHRLPPEPGAVADWALARLKQAA